MVFDKIKARKPNMFEQMLLVLGIVVIAVGYYMVHLVVLNYGLGSFEVASVLFFWFISILLIIVTAVAENSKEEIKMIIKFQHDELKLLRQDLRRKK